MFCILNAKNIEHYAVEIPSNKITIQSERKICNIEIQVRQLSQVIFVLKEYKGLEGFDVIDIDTEKQVEVQVDKVVTDNQIEVSVKLDVGKYKIQIIDFYR